MTKPKFISTLAAFGAALIATSLSANAAVSIVGVNTNTDAAYGADASSTDLVNTGAPTLASAPTYSAGPFQGNVGDNDGGVGSVNTLSDITFWLGASGGSQYSITYALDTSVNTLGYDINSIQTIHGWTSNSGNQKNQNYEVFVSTVGDAGFTGSAIEGTGGTSIATVAYLPYSTTSTANVTGSTRVNITEDATGLLAGGVDEIRFIYTVPNPSGGGNPSPTIREIDVFGQATAVPEPSSAGLLGLAALGFILRRRRI